MSWKVVSWPRSAVLAHQLVVYQPKVLPAYTSRLTLAPLFFSCFGPFLLLWKLSFWRFGWESCLPYLILQPNFLYYPARSPGVAIVPTLHAQTVWGVRFMPSRRGFLFCLLCSLVLLSLSLYLFTLWSGTDLWAIAVILFLLAGILGLKALGQLRQGICPDCGRLFPQYTLFSGFKKYQFWHRNKIRVTRLICLNCGCELRRSEKKIPRW